MILCEMSTIIFERVVNKHHSIYSLKSRVLNPESNPISDGMDVKRFESKIMGNGTLKNLITKAKENSDTVQNTMLSYSSGSRSIFSIHLFLL